MAINAQTGEPQDAAGFSTDGTDDPKAASGGPSTLPIVAGGSSPLAPQSPMDQTQIGAMEGARVAGEQPYREKVLKLLDDPAAATAHLEKVKDAPNPQDYKKYSMEFASAMAVIGAIAGKWTRHAGNAALNSFTAALNGWHQGNLEAYEQASKQWEQSTKQTLANNDAELEKYHEIMNNKQANIDQMMAAMQVAGAESQNKIIMDLAASKNFTGVFNAVDKMQQANGRLQSSLGQLTGLRKDQQSGLAEKVQYLNDHPKEAAKLSPKDYLTLRGAASTIGLHLNDQPQVNPAVDAIVDQVGTYKVNLQTALSRLPATDREKVMTGLREKYPQYSQQVFNAQNAGGTSAMRAAGGRAGQIEVSSQEAAGTFVLAKEASHNLPRGSFQPITRLQQLGQKATSNPAYRQFMAANESAVTAYAATMSRNGANTVSAQERAHTVLDTADSQEAYDAGIDQLQNEVDVVEHGDKSGSL